MRVLLPTLIVLLGCSCFAPTMAAGPNRKAEEFYKQESKTENRTRGGVYTNQSVKLDESINNKCSVTVGAGDKTWVLAEGVIQIVPSTVRYTRNYGLYGYDSMIRLFIITGCEVSRWVVSASIGMEVKAEVALTGGLNETGDVFALAHGLAFVEVNGVLLKADVRECVAGTRNLETNPVQDLVAGTSDIGYMDKNYPDARKTSVKVANDGNRTVSAELTLRLNIPDTEYDGPTLYLFYRSWAMVGLRVPATNGWALAYVKHHNYDPTGMNANSWKVTAEAWDDDDPDDPIRIKTFKFSPWGA